MLAFENKVITNRPEFIQKVKDIAFVLQTDPNWLMAVMNAESGLNPRAQNTKYPLHNGPATGLIQFTPDTAQGLGTSIDQLVNMSNVKQLDYVKDYFEPYAGRLRSYFDVYTAVFFPAAIGKPDEWVFETKNIARSTVARQNPGIDANKDGKITVAEFKGYLYRTIPAQLKNIIFYIKDVIQKNPATSVAVIIAVLLIITAK